MSTAELFRRALHGLVEARRLPQLIIMKNTAKNKTHTPTTVVRAFDSATSDFRFAAN